MKLRDYTLIAPSKKAVSLEQFNNDALWRETTYDTRAPRNKQADVAKAQNFREAIGTMYRCIDVRATTVAATPFMVFRGEKPVYNSNVMTDDTEYPWLDSIQALLALTEASLLLSSEAFWFKELALAGNLLDIRWLAAPYISPIYSEMEGITGFKRMFGTREEIYKRDSVAYFFVQNPMTELMPDIPQVLAASNSAGVILNYEDFVSKFYERGAVKATILKVDRSTPPKERARLKDFWQNFMNGGKNAYTTEVVSGDVEAEVIGEGAGDSEKTEVLVSRRKDIATAMGVPYSLLFGDTSSSYTAGPTETKNFLNFTIIPRVKLIQRALNRQIFMPLGLKIRFLTESLPAFKDSYEAEAKIFTSYTNALLPHSVAAQLAGITLPEGIKYEDLDDMVAKERERQFREKEQIVTLNSKIGQDNGEKPQDPDKLDNNMRSAEISKYKKWLKNRKDEDIDPYAFKSDILTDEEKITTYKSFVEERGGSNDNPPFSLSDHVVVKALVTVPSAEPDGLLEVEEENANAINAVFTVMVPVADEEAEFEQFSEQIRKTFDENSSALYDTILKMMLGYATMGVASGFSKVSKYNPNFSAEDSYYQARAFAVSRADEAFRLIQDTTMRRLDSLFSEYKRGNKLGIGWLIEEIKKFLNIDRARLIASNESMAVVRYAERIVFTNSKVVKMVRWFSTRDERTCGICGPRHGRVYPLAAAPLAPVHVGCRCALLPMVDTRVVTEQLYV